MEAKPATTASTTTARRSGVVVRRGRRGRTGAPGGSAGSGRRHGTTTSGGPGQDLVQLAQVQVVARVVRPVPRSARPGRRSASPTIPIAGWSGDAGGDPGVDEPALPCGGPADPSSAGCPLVPLPVWRGGGSGIPSERRGTGPVERSAAPVRSRGRPGAPMLRRKWSSRYDLPSGRSHRPALHSWPAGPVGPPNQRRSCPRDVRVGPQGDRQGAGPDRSGPRALPPPLPVGRRPPGLGPGPVPGHGPPLRLVLPPRVERLPPDPTADGHRRGCRAADRSRPGPRPVPRSLALRHARRGLPSGRHGGHHQPGPGPGEPVQQAAAGAHQRDPRRRGVGLHRHGRAPVRLATGTRTPHAPDR